VPVYSHRSRSVVEHRRFATPRWLILEGVYALQPALTSGLTCCSLYLDAEVSDVQGWYLERFLRLHRWRFASTSEAEQHGRQVYERINYPNLVQCIAPLRSQADIVLRRSGSGSWLLSRQL
jgi:type I pantothenate kinase